MGRKKDGRQLYLNKFSGGFKCFKYYLNLNLCIAVHCAEEMVYSEYIVYKSCGELSISKVSKFQKQIILFSILPKNEQKTSILGF